MMKSDDDRTRIEWIYADVWSVLDPRKSAKIRFDPRASAFGDFSVRFRIVRVRLLTWWGLEPGTLRDAGALQQY